MTSCDFGGDGDCSGPARFAVVSIGGAQYRQYLDGRIDFCGVFFEYSTSLLKEARGASAAAKAPPPHAHPLTAGCLAMDKLCNSCRVRISDGDHAQSCAACNYDMCVYYTLCQVGS